jgi:hypothetical protein
MNDVTAFFLSVAVLVVGSPVSLANVSEFDSRLAADTSLAPADGLIWFDAAALPLESKICAETATPYGRIPKDLMDKVPTGVRGMAGHSTGHYFHFRTDSSRLGIRWQCAQTSATDPYIPPQGMYGVDIYVKVGRDWRFVKNGRLVPGQWQETRADLPGSGPHETLVYLPIRADVLALRFGVEEEKELTPCGHARGDVKPVVHYGTSIVHGGCVSRPGLVFTSVAARTLDVPYVNLGFSGSARLEPVMADVMARTEASLYIVDTAWNCSAQIVRERAEPFLRKLHALRPETPILLCEGPEAAGCRLEVNTALKAVYDRLASAGALDGNLSYLPCDGLLPLDGESTHDYVHPNDYGSLAMAKAFASAISKALALPAEVRSPDGSAVQ